MNPVMLTQGEESRKFGIHDIYYCRCETIWCIYNDTQSWNIWNVCMYVYTPICLFGWPGELFAGINETKQTN